MQRAHSLLETANSRNASPERPLDELIVSNDGDVLFCSRNSGVQQFTGQEWRVVIGQGYNDVVVFAAL